MDGASHSRRLGRVAALRPSRTFKLTDVAVDGETLAENVPAFFRHSRHPWRSDAGAAHEVIALCQC
jgi:hypothetical protein